MMKACLWAVCLSLVGCANVSRTSEQVDAALSLTPQHFIDTISIKDDALDTTATITTVNGLKEKRGMMGVVWDDNFLRAFIDKKTGKTTIQVYQVIYYQAPSWNFYRSVNYETLTGPVSKPVTTISRDVSCRASRYTGCTYVEHIAFEVDEGLLREIGDQYQPEQRRVWRFKFKAKSGEEYHDGMLPAEISGFLTAIRRYKERSGIS